MLIEKITTKVGQMKSIRNLTRWCWSNIHQLTVHLPRCPLHHSNASLCQIPYPPLPYHHQHHKHRCCHLFYHHLHHYLYLAPPTYHHNDMVRQKSNLRTRNLTKIFFVGKIKHDLSCQWQIIVLE